MSGDKYLPQLKSLVLSYFAQSKVKIVLFGSRARQTNSLTSDVDIGIIPGDNFDDEKLTLLRDKVDEMNVPYKVEIVNFNQVSDEFSKEALKEVIIWKDYD